MNLIEEVMRAVVKGARETVTVSLGHATFEVLDTPAKLLDKSTGAFIPLTGEGWAMQIGILLDASGGSRLAESLLGAAPASKAEEADALGEIVNIIAGVVKRNVTLAGARLQLGLPFGFNGEIYFKEPIEMAARSCTSDSINMLLIVIVKKTGA